MQRQQHMPNGPRMTRMLRPRWNQRHNEFAIVSVGRVIRGPFVASNDRTFRRAGFNLVELLFAVTAISALSVLAMTVVAMLMTAEQHSAEGLWIDVTVANLADDLRSDAHGAIDLEATPDAEDRLTQIALVQPDDVRVVYACTAEGVVRRQMHGENVVATETYRLALGASTFALPGDDGLLTWTHTRGIPNIGGFSQQKVAEVAPQRRYEIVTAVGLHTSLFREGGG